jgi:hypothetical protein
VQAERRRVQTARVECDRAVAGVRYAMQMRLRELRDGLGSDLDGYQRACLGDWRLRRMARQILAAELWADFLIESGAVVHEGRWVVRPTS